MDFKKCSKCGNVKHISQFSKDIRTKDKLKSECKSCHRNYPRNKRKDNWITDLSDEYVKSKLVRSGFTIEQINDNPELIEIRRNLMKLRRTINGKT